MFHYPVPSQPRTFVSDLNPWTPCMQERHWLLRKEVIQPHLPVRLPCYDLVLITGPTFDSSLPYGLGHRLRVLPTFMTCRAVCTSPGNVFTAALLICDY